MKKVIRVTGCIVTFENKILMLYRSEKETDPSLWGIPAGRVEADENDNESVVRELQEETGISVHKDEVTFLSELTIEYEILTVQFPIFHIILPELPKVILDPEEHLKFAWMRPDEILELPDLMQDVDKIITEVAIKKLKL